MSTFPPEPPEPRPEVGEESSGDEAGGQLDVQPVNVEPVENELEQVPPVTDDHAPSFTAGEKIGSLLDVVFAGHYDDPKARAILRAISTARRFHLLDPVLEAFPPLEDSAAWDEWLALAVGVCLNLVSDGVELDVDQLEATGAVVLGQLFADEGAAGVA